MNYKNIIHNLRNKKDYKIIINNENNFLYKCLLSKNFLSSNQYSLLIEKEIKKDNISGDAIFNNKSVEIKISFGDIKNKFHFAQIRPHYNIDYYIFMLYDIYKNNFGKISWFLINSNDLYELLPKISNYAHSSKKKFGNIITENIQNNSHEYSIRFFKKDKIYNILKQFKIKEENLIKFFSI